MNMNPYDNNEEISQPIIQNVEVWVDNGKKKNTFISGLTFTLTELKEHLKNLKKKVGCNGSIKKNEDSDDLILQLQGNHIDIICEYFKANGVLKISIKG